jgi:glutathione-regulated potassium-efflux system ancillary protein KefG
MAVGARRVLILFAHPAYEKSKVHAQLSAAVRGLPGVTFHDLYEAYPDQDVDVRREQDLLVSHDVIVFQHPFYWYSVPPLLKQWMDLVLEHGWAYGSSGMALKGKVLQVAMTAGGREMAYGPEGFNRFTFREFLTPVEATARLCRMEFREPWVIAGTHAITPEETARAAQRYAALITSLSES